MQPTSFQRGSRESVTEGENGELGNSRKDEFLGNRRCHLGVAEFTGSHLGHLLNSPVEIGQVVLGEGRSILKVWFSVGC